MRSSLGNRIRALTLQMISENANCAPILEGLGAVFACTADWSATEAEEVLTVLLKEATDEGARLLSHLLLYYGVYRERETDKLGPFDSTRLKPLLRQDLVYGSAAIRSSILWRISKTLETRGDDAKMLLPYVAEFALGVYERNAFFHFYKIAADHMRGHSEMLGPALREAFRRERDYIRSCETELIWDFSGHAWSALKRLFESGRVDEFLDCVQVVVDYRGRIFRFPETEIEIYLRKIPSVRAREVLDLLNFGQ